MAPVQALMSYAGLRPITSQPLARKPISIARPARAGRAARGVPCYASGDQQLRVGVLYKNPFANLGNMSKLMEQAKQAQQVMQVEAVKVQAELAATEFEGYDSDELVRVVLNGSQEPLATEITEEAMSKGAEELGGILTEAYKDAHSKSITAMKDRMKELASKIGLPPGMGM